MKLSDIKRQANSKHRFSIFIDQKYAFSLSQAEIVKNDLKIGKEIDEGELKRLKVLSAQDKLYIMALKLTAARLKSEWEVSTYLERKGASPTLTQDILNKLSDLRLIDDYKFAEIFVRNQSLHSPASRRKILAKLKQKRVKQEAIEAALADGEGSDQAALRAIIKSKQSKYPDRTKFMAYLARQGFNYSDILSNLDVGHED